MRQRRQRSAMVRTRGALAIDALWSGGARTVRRAQRLRPRVLARARRVSRRSAQPATHEPGWDTWRLTNSGDLFVASV